MDRLRGKEAIGHISDVSLLNFSEEIRADMDLPKRVVLGDLTLREGRQLEGRVLTTEQCLRVARAIDEAGFPTLQVPFSDRPGEQELLDQMSKQGLKARIEVLTNLDAVRWPTASVILHFFHRDRYPIMDFRALWSISLPVPVQYNFDFWWPYVQFCRDLSKRTDMDMRTLDRAIWQLSKEKQKDA